MFKMPIQIYEQQYSSTKSFALNELIRKTWAEEIHENENFCAGANITRNDSIATNETIDISSSKNISKEGKQ